AARGGVRLPYAIRVVLDQEDVAVAVADDVGAAEVGRAVETSGDVHVPGSVYGNGACHLELRASVRVGPHVVTVRIKLRDNKILAAGSRDGALAEIRADVVRRNQVHVAGCVERDSLAGVVVNITEALRPFHIALAVETGEPDVVHPRGGHGSG